MDGTVTTIDVGGYDRVRAHTAPYVNERIDRQIEGSIQRLARSEREQVRERLAELDREWDVDRAVMAVMAVAGSVSLQLGLTRRRFFFFPLRAQLAFLFLHAVVGWCPPIALLRRLGFRTHREIEAEKTALRRLVEARPMATA